MHCTVEAEEAREAGDPVVELRSPPEKEDQKRDPLDLLGPNKRVRVSTDLCISSMHLQMSISHIRPLCQGDDGVSGGGRKKGWVAAIYLLRLPGLILIALSGSGWNFFLFFFLLARA